MQFGVFGAERVNLHYHHFVRPNNELPSLNHSFWQAVNAFAAHMFTKWPAKRNGQQNVQNFERFGLV